MGKHSSDEPNRERLREGMYTQEEINDVVNRSITVNVGPQSDIPATYPGLGATVHLLHAILTFLTGGLWAFVWIIHTLVARSKWNSQLRAAAAEKAVREQG